MGADVVLPRQFNPQETGWLGRLRAGKPVLECGDGSSVQQQLHVDDCAAWFGLLLGQRHTIGQVWCMRNEDASLQTKTRALRA